MVGESGTPRPSSIQAVRERRRGVVELARPDVRGEIFTATERLLGGTPLHELNVAQILLEAGISRATFYSYFESKYEVVAGLLGQVMEEMYERLKPFVVAGEGSSRKDALRRMLVETTALWCEHRVVFCASHEHWHAVPDIAEQWLRVMERFTDAVALEVEREIEAGRVTRGVDARQRAAAVLWSSEQMLYVAAKRVDDDLPDESAIVPTLEALWIGTLFAGVRPAELMDDGAGT